jgi:hypothetical protein
MLGHGYFLLVPITHYKCFYAFLLVVFLLVSSHSLSKGESMVTAYGQVFIKLGQKYRALRLKRNMVQEDVGNFQAQ